MFDFLKKTTVEIKIEGMHCPKCAEKVKKALSGVGGVSLVAVDLEKKCATLKVGAKFDISVAKAAVTAAGFEVVA